MDNPELIVHVKRGSTRQQYETGSTRIKARDDVLTIASDSARLGDQSGRVIRRIAMSEFDDIVTNHVWIIPVLHPFGDGAHRIVLAYDGRKYTALLLAPDLTTVAKFTVTLHALTFAGLDATDRSATVVATQCDRFADIDPAFVPGWMKWIETMIMVEYAGSLIPELYMMQQLNPATSDPLVVVM